MTAQDEGQRSIGFTQGVRVAVAYAPPSDECNCENPEPAEGVALVSDDCPIHGGDPERWS